MTTDSSIPYHKMFLVWRRHLEAALQEDGWPWDWASLASENKKITAQIHCKASGIWAANSLLETTHRVSAEWGLPLSIKSKLHDGQSVEKGQVVAEIIGPAQSIWAFERPVLNLASFVCGVASQTYALCELVRWTEIDPLPRVCSTRKTLPGLRDVSLFGVMVGGGHCHRINLAAAPLLKENHIAQAGGIPEAIAGAKAVSPHGSKIEIEVQDQDQLQQAVQAGAEVVMLDNFEPEQVKRALQWLKSQDPPSPIIEVSGGISASNIQDYCLQGVDVISVGGLTHTVKPLDLSLIAH